MEINSRQLLLLSRKDVWNLPEEAIVVTYEDDVVVTNTKKDVIFNRYCWDTVLYYPKTRLVSKLDVKTMLDGSFFNGDTHIQLLERVFKQVCLDYNIHEYKYKEPVLKLIYGTVNLIFNELVNRVSDHVTTIDATDFVNLINDEEITSIRDDFKPIPEYVDKSYKRIKTYVNDKSVSNRFVAAYRSKAINENQANQCIGPRGFVTDLDRTVFKLPISNGFIKGMGNLYELITESRTAAKSINANSSQIQTSEYASRRIQLLTMSITGVDTVDCGSTEYYDMLLSANMLENMKGIYYLDKKTNTLKYFTGDEEHLVDTVVSIRTALGCKASDPTKICTTCLGKISENFKENSNIGYTTTSYLMEKLTQSILSTKHLTHSVKKSLITLEGIANKYFYTNKENNIFFNKELELTGLQLILPNNRLSKLTDVLSLQHTNISLTKIGELDIISIKDTNHKTPITETATISYRDRCSIITKELLNYIKSVEMTSDSRGNFIIPLDNYNKEEPVFNNPLKESNIISFVNRIASMIETVKDKQSDPYERLFNLFYIVTDQLKCNFTIIQTILYATTTYNSFNNNYRLGRDSVHPKCESNTVLFRHRSVGQLLVYEHQSDELINNTMYLFNSKNRLSHPMDVLFKPEDIVKS